MICIGIMYDIFYKLLGLCVVYDLCRRRLYDYGFSSNW